MQQQKKKNTHTHYQVEGFQKRSMEAKRRADNNAVMSYPSDISIFRHCCCCWVIALLVSVRFLCIFTLCMISSCLFFCSCSRLSSEAPILVDVCRCCLSKPYSRIFVFVYVRSYVMNRQLKIKMNSHHTAVFAMQPTTTTTAPAKEYTHTHKNPAKQVTAATNSSERCKKVVKQAQEERMRAEKHI